MSMKYDSNMTQFHDDIVAAIKSMIHGEEDKVAELAAEISSVPLKDYLKDKRFQGNNKYTAMSSCMLVVYDHVINNSGESRLQLSWSQVAAFIRKYPAEIFNKADVKQNKLADSGTTSAPSCSCPLWRSEAFTTIGDRKRSVSFSCDAYNTEDVTEENTVSDIVHRCNNYLDCKHFLVHELEPVLKDESIKVNINTPLDRLKQLYESHCQQTVPVPSGIGAPAKQALSETPVFDYSELDSDTAAKLENVTAEIFSVKKDYIFTMAKKVAYAHELLASHYGGKFGVWCESIGISRDTGNNLVRVAEIFGNISAEEQKNLSQLKPSLLYEVAKPSAPPELVEQVMNGDITTHKEYIKLKKELSEAQEKAAFWNKANTATNEENQKLRAERVNAMNRADNAERELSEAQAEIEKLNREADEADREYDAMADRECHYETEICKLEQRIKELENKPVDVAVQPDEETLAKKDQEISELKKEILRMNDKNIKSFIVRMSLDECEEILKALETNEHSHLRPIMQNAKIIKL